MKKPTFYDHLKIQSQFFFIYLSHHPADGV